MQFVARPFFHPAYHFTVLFAFKAPAAHGAAPAAYILAVKAYALLVFQAVAEHNPAQAQLFLKRQACRPVVGHDAQGLPHRGRLAGLKALLGLQQLAHCVLQQDELVGQAGQGLGL